MQECSPTHCKPFHDVLPSEAKNPGSKLLFIDDGNKRELFRFVEDPAHLEQTAHMTVNFEHCPQIVAARQ
jgi:hypothetical protein